jgi:Putative prokaryotic signal transducing protein
MGVKGWTVIFSGYRYQADIVAAALEAKGLRVEVFGDYGFGPALSVSDNARIMVPHEQAEAARRVIKEAEDKNLPEDV